MSIFLFTLLTLPLGEGFFVPPPATGHLGSSNACSASSGKLRSDARLWSLPAESSRSGDSAPLLALNDSRIDAAALAETKRAVGAYQVTRPRWYNKAEAAIILLLVQRYKSTCLLLLYDTYIEASSVIVLCGCIVSYDVCMMRTTSSSTHASRSRHARAEVFVRSSRYDIRCDMGCLLEMSTRCG